MKVRLFTVLTAVILLAVCCVAGETSSSSSTSPRVFSTSPSALKGLREQVATGKFNHIALDKLRSDADKALKMEILSVTQKSMIPPSGDKHDYMSLARYWWPDPTKPGGLPYIRRDGEVNPEIKQVPDHDNLDHLIKATNKLALAYYLFGDEKYAAQATKLLRGWFLDPATRMNPNLNFAQATRGRNTGRGSGLIDSRELSHAVDTIGLLADSKAWTADDQKGMQQWFSDYLKWLQTSKNGRDESQARNNHGAYYEAQVASIALFVGDTKLATKVLDREKDRISWQIRKDGSQPLELERTRSLWYSTFNLLALFQLAQLGENVGVDLWNFKTKNGADLRKALDYLTPYVTGEQKWTFPQIDEYRKDVIVPLYYTAAAKYKAPEYEKIAEKIQPGPSKDFDCLIATFQKAN